MRLLATVGRLLFLMIVALFVALPTAKGETLTPEAQRARKNAIRKYEGAAVALPDSAFANGLRVCARETPSGINGYWRVPAKVVDLIDADLMVHLRKSGLDKKLQFPAKIYMRQYAGFVRDGVRFVYVSALLVEKGKPAAAEAKKEFPRSCSEVSGFWGIQYDTKTKQFSGFATR